MGAPGKARNLPADVQCIQYLFNLIIRKLSLFESEIEAAKKAAGGAVPSGIYAHGSACEADVDSLVDRLTSCETAVIAAQ